MVTLNAIDAHLFSIQHSSVRKKLILSHSSFSPSHSLSLCILNITTDSWINVFYSMYYYLFILSDTEIVPNLASASPFKPAPASFWHVLVNLLSCSCFLAYEDIPTQISHFPSDPISLYWRMVFRKTEWGSSVLIAIECQLLSSFSWQS